MVKIFIKICTLLRKECIIKDGICIWRNCYRTKLCDDEQLYKVLMGIGVM